ncbi:hypothetical protein [Streptomyces sp. CB01580]|uniref:hypothetical protein n=1 Tax=Streptomyces sp. CB01580 TaxID=1703933 RepID=UPI0009388A23|nr:hypothetical protein [Streptomyces sp. CB01580]OKJ41597.1 hypothetical protein AMK22_09085 [Streptomyces sp. CB01580]
MQQLPLISGAESDRFINLPKELEDDLTKIGGTLPAWKVEGAFQADSTIEQYRTKLDSAPLFNEIRGPSSSHSTGLLADTP